MRMNRISAVTVSLVMAGFAAAAERSEVPLGHKDFYPSAAQPVGFRGDGNGCFPGATPVTDWREGTVEMKKQGPIDVLTTTDKKAHHIVWKTEMPSWANAQPIVVGDRVFTTAEPNMLVCVDANTGKVLWTATINPWELRGIDKAQADKIQTMYDLWREGIPHFDHMRGNGTMARHVPSIEFGPIAKAFTETTLPRILRALKEVDPSGPYEEAAKITDAAVKKYSQSLMEGDKAGTPFFTAKHDPLNGQMDRLSQVLGKRINEYADQTGSGRARVENIPLEVPWGHLVGFCGAAPVSDGQFVYASFGQGQTVCYDLNGKRIWGVQLQPSSQTCPLCSPPCWRATCWWTCTVAPRSFGGWTNGPARSSGKRPPWARGFAMTATTSAHTKWYA